jgi:hypothetical protein
MDKKADKETDYVFFNGYLVSVCGLESFKHERIKKLVHFRTGVRRKNIISLLAA